MIIFPVSSARILAAIGWILLICIIQVRVRITDLAVFSSLYKETGKMIIATKQLFYAMEVQKLLHFQNADMSAVSFAMTVHGLMDYEPDLRSGECKTENQERNNLDEYLQWFCRENATIGIYTYSAPYF